MSSDRAQVLSPPPANQSRWILSKREWSCSYLWHSLRTFRLRESNRLIEARWMRRRSDNYVVQRNDWAKCSDGRILRCNNCICHNAHSVAVDGSGTHCTRLTPYPCRRFAVWLVSVFRSAFAIWWPRLAIGCEVWCLDRWEPPPQNWRKGRISRLRARQESNACCCFVDEFPVNIERTLRQRTIAQSKLPAGKSAYWWQPSLCFLLTVLFDEQKKMWRRSRRMKIMLKSRTRSPFNGARASPTLFCSSIAKLLNNVFYEFTSLKYLQRVVFTLRRYASLFQRIHCVAMRIPHVTKL